MTSIRRSISISETQDKFLRYNNISLSKLIQKTINKKIEDMAFLIETKKNLEEMDRGKYEEMDFDEFMKEAPKW